MTKSNLDIWAKVATTDPSKTKNFKAPGGFQGTAINPTYLVKKATELFGPIGLGWGYEILEDRFDQGAPIIDQETKVPTGAFLQTHTIKLKLWYLHQGEKLEVTHYGHTPFVYQTKHGLSTDFESAKKSLTDAIKKCLSMIGFSADIMLGDFEDPDYRQEIKEKLRIDKAEDKIAETETIKAEHKEWLEKHLRIIETAVTMNELEKVFSIVYRTLKARRDDASIKKVTLAKEKRKKVLQKITPQIEPGEPEPDKKPTPKTTTRRK